MSIFVLMSLPKKLKNKLNQRREESALRSIKPPSNMVDFSSNDYLGFASSEEIFDKTHQYLLDKNLRQNGATGSRLLSGNYPLYQDVEELLCSVHKAESSLVFNSGYDANIGFFSSVPQRGDVILYDEFIHASIRDGVQLSNAKSYKFKHNNLRDLEKLLKRFSGSTQDGNSVIYVVSESVFSMDGDSPDLKELVKVCKNNSACLIIDEAHAVGVFEFGLTQKLGLEKEVFARVITFGKALGCHGAAILGSESLKEYLVNFTRSFIYTTGLSPHSLATVFLAYKTLENLNKIEDSKLQKNIEHFILESKRLQLNFIPSCSAIHCCVISGNKKVKSIAYKLQQNGFDVKPILSPTVSENQERLRFCLHSYNSKEEITNVLEQLATFVAE